MNGELGARPYSLFTIHYSLFTIHCLTRRNRMKKPSDVGTDRSSRRDFLKRTTAAVVGGGIASRLGTIPGAYAAGSDMIRVGLIGCGERGTGAATNVLGAAAGVKLVAMGDGVKDHLDTSLDVLRKSEVAGNVDGIGRGSWRERGEDSG